MKRSRFIFALCAVLLCCSCGSRKNTVTPLVRGISFFAVMTCYHETYACDVVIEKDGKATLCFSEPEALAGLTFLCEDDILTAEYAGLRHQWSGANRLRCAAAGILFGVFSDVPKAGSPVCEDNRYTVTDKMEGTAYTLTLGATGLPISLKMSEKGFYATFQNVTIL